MPELKRRGRPRKDDKQVPVVVLVSQELATQLKKMIAANSFASVE